MKRIAGVWLFALTASPMAGAETGLVQPGIIMASPTSMTSSTKRMISYRDQRHSWQTSDGAIHLLINEGTVPAGDGLTLYSSFDGGTTWVQELTLANTDASTTSDGLLGSASANSNVLQLVYSTAAPSYDIVYATATYDSAAQSWTLTSTQTAFSSATVAASEPALAVDSLGNLWCAFTAEDVATEEYQIQMLYRPENLTKWISTALSFGGADTSTLHSGRPVPLKFGVGMIYQTDTTMYWAYRLSSWSVNTPWTTSVLYTGLPPASQDPYDSHFSVVADAGDNLYLGFAGNSQLLYTVYDSATKNWGAINSLTPSTDSSTYMKASIAGGNVFLTVNDQSSLLVFQSANAGKTFVLTQELLHQVPAQGSGLNYQYPRVEAPAYALGPVPTWQQYENGSNQGLMFFSVPVVK
jgi:hypothetical protein